MNFAPIKKLLRLFFAMVIFCGILLSANTALAASLYISPSSKTYHAGDTFSISAYVSTGNDAMNACEATIDYPSDLLEATSVSSKSSIFSLMVENASISSANGTARFSGVVLNPGYTGSSGRLITINFRAKKVGTAILSFVGAQVLANDGSGSSILSSRGTATINILEALPAPEKKPETTQPTITKPQGSGGIATTTIKIVTATPVIATTVVNIVESPNYPISQLPTFFLKIGNVTFDTSSACLLLIIIMILCSASVSIWGFAHMIILSRKAAINLAHHITIGRKINAVKTIKKISKLKK